MESFTWRLYWKIIKAGIIGDYNASLPDLNEKPMVTDT